MVLVAAFSDRADSIAAMMEKSLLDANVLLIEMTKVIEDAQPAFRSTTTAMDRIGSLAEEIQPEVAPLAQSARISLDEFNKIAKELRLAASNIASVAGEADELLAENRDSLSEFSKLDRLVQEKTESFLVLTPLPYLFQA